MSEREIQYLLLVGAYRDNEVDATHPLMMILEEIKKESKGFSSIHLQNLVKQDLNTLISETLVCQPNSSQPLTDLVYAKTQGNAFFTNEFLKSLYTEGLLKFDRQKRKWQWNLAQIQEKGMTENVIELMAGKIQKLREDRQQVLKMSACIGNQFELETLAVVCEKSPKETAVLMQAPVEEGLVLPIGDAYKSIELDVPTPGGGSVEYKFAHDRIQQAAYSLIGETKKQATHLQIGRLLLANTNADELTENIFDIVDQFNEGIALISDKQELVKLAELNLIAGQKAKAATAYGSAVKYLNVGLELLADDSWTHNYDLTLDLYVEAIEAEYFNSNFKQSNALAEVALHRAKTLLERVKVYELKIQSYIAQNQMQAAIDTGMQALEILEVQLEQEPPQILTIETLVSLPEMTQPYKLAALRILIVLIDPSYIANPRLSLLITFTMVNLCIKYGNSPLATYAYVYYGLLLCGPLLNIDAGIDLVKRL